MADITAVPVYCAKCAREIDMMAGAVLRGKTLYHHECVDTPAPEQGGEDEAAHWHEAYIHEHDKRTEEMKALRAAEARIAAAIARFQGYPVHPTDKDWASEVYAILTGTGEPAPAGEHEWIKRPELSFESCGKCGIVRRADGKNSPCKGYVRVELRTEPAPARETWRHIKTGGLYELREEECPAILEADLTPMTIYRSLKDGRIWIRPSTEFYDGRFEKVSAGGHDPVGTAVPGRGNDTVEGADPSLLRQSGRVAAPAPSSAVGEALNECASSFVLYTSGSGFISFDALASEFNRRQQIAAKALSSLSTGTKDEGA